MDAKVLPTCLRRYRESKRRTFLAFSSTYHLSGVRRVSVARCFYCSDAGADLEVLIASRVSLILADVLIISVTWWSLYTRDGLCFKLGRDSLAAVLIGDGEYFGAQAVGFFLASPLMSVDRNYLLSVKRLFMRNFAAAHVTYGFSGSCSS